MKFSKSWILTMSCMLLVNSFLLVATAYATDVANNKNISIDPSNAKQNIEEIILSDWSTKKLCSIVVFDKSWSMANNYQGRNPNKRNNAVSWAILYSTIILEQDPNAKIWLVLFSTDAIEKVPLWREEFTTSKFDFPNWSTNYTSAIKKAREMLTWHNNECEIKNIIFMTDWEPTDQDKNNYENQVTQAKNDWIMLYSIWYNISNNWKKILGGLSAGWFYDTDSTNISTIFKKLATPDNRLTSIKKDNDKFKIKTYNAIFTKSWSTIKNFIERSTFSNILWWIKNNISANSFACSIIDWHTNIIHTSSNSTILWWEENKIENSEEASIIWWFKNEIVYWKYSTIWWWKENKITNSNYSTIIWNYSKITNGNNSVAMWSGTIISGGNNSFYWNDGSSNKELHKNNVFAVVSKNGVAFNTNTPHEAAQLTISWNLSITPNNNDENITCWDWNWKWIIKAVQKNDNRDECLCSCNWTKRESLYNWACEWICNNEIVPACWSSVTFNYSNKTYQGSCSSWTVIDNSYFVTKENIIHRTCQTHDGNIANCTWTLNK